MSLVLLAGCAILKDRRILLIRKKDKDIWELPGGIVQNKDDLEGAAVEKTASQIGVAPAIIQHFTILEYQVNGRNMEATIFECDIPEDAVFTPGGNVEEVSWFDIAKLKDQPIANDVKEIIEDL